MPPEATMDRESHDHVLDPFHHRGQRAPRSVAPSKCGLRDQRSETHGATADDGGGPNGLVHRDGRLRTVALQSAGNHPDQDSEGWPRHRTRRPHVQGRAHRARVGLPRRRYRHHVHVVDHRNDERRRDHARDNDKRDRPRAGGHARPVAGGRQASRRRRFGLCGLCRLGRGRRGRRRPRRHPRRRVRRRRRGFAGRRCLPGIGPRYGDHQSLRRRCQARGGRARRLCRTSFRALETSTARVTTTC